jgi:hypothetical protein
MPGSLLRSTTTVSKGGGTISITTEPPNTLVIYVFSDTDPGCTDRVEQSKH